MNFKNSALSLSVISILQIMPVSAIAQERVSLHNMSEAEVEYANFKSGNASDPLELIRKGYKEAYSEDLNSNVSESKLVITEEMISSENKRVNEFISSLGVTKSTSKRDIYESSLNDEGEFDHEAYAADYLGYLSSNKYATEEAIYDRDSFAIEVFEGSNGTLSEVGTSHTNNAYTASENIISLINANSANYVQSVRELLDGAVEQTRVRVPVGAETLVLAYEFDGSCGETCTFPELPIPEEPVSNCVYDGNNYILITESDHSEYGTYETKTYDETYYFNGSRVYYYSEDSNNRGGSWDENVNETGSKEGYTFGKSMGFDYSSTGYGGSQWEEWEICEIPEEPVSNITWKPTNNMVHETFKKTGSSVVIGGSCTSEGAIGYYDYKYTPNYCSTSPTCSAKEDRNYQYSVAVCSR
jgi:hypothetical protein